MVASAGSESLEEVGNKHNYDFSPNALRRKLWGVLGRIDSRWELVRPGHGVIQAGEAGGGGECRIEMLAPESKQVRGGDEAGGGCPAGRRGTRGEGQGVVIAGSKRTPNGEAGGEKQNA